MLDVLQKVSRNCHDSDLIFKVLYCSNWEVSAKGSGEGVIDRA